jgi:hypothetical protein
VVSGRFAFEMKYEAFLRLAVLHMRLLSEQTGQVSSSRAENSVSSEDRSKGIDLKQIE